MRGMLQGGQGKIHVRLSIRRKSMCVSIEMSVGLGRNVNHIGHWDLHLSMEFMSVIHSTLLCKTSVMEQSYFSSTCYPFLTKHSSNSTSIISIYLCSFIFLHPLIIYDMKELPFIERHSTWLEYKCFSYTLPTFGSWKSSLARSNCKRKIYHCVRC